MALGFVVRFLNGSQEAKEMLKDWDRTFQFDLEGESPFYVEITNGGASIAGGRKAQADVFFKAKSSVFMKILRGDLNADEAFFSKKYDVSGSAVDAARFRLLGELVEKRHPLTFRALKGLSRVLESMGL